MKKFTDLFLFEVKRIKKVYLLLVATIIFLQISSVLLASRSYMNIFRNYQIETRGNMFAFLEQWHKFDFYQVQTYFLYEFSVMLGIAVLVFYVFVIWYRDWVGKNNLSYRLLTLPGSRMSLFYAKLACILFLIGGLLATQVIMLFVGEALIGLVIPGDLYESIRFLGHTSKSTIVSYVLPSRLFDFILHYLIGTTVLIVAKLLIILRLSFKWKGLAIGITLVGILILLLSSLMLSDMVYYLFPLETLLLMIAVCILIISASLATIHFLLKNKISI